MERHIDTLIAILCTAPGYEVTTQRNFVDHF